MREKLAAPADSGAVVLRFPQNGNRMGCGVKDVERINQFAFYELGRALKHCTSRADDIPAMDIVFDIMQAETLLERLLERDDPIPIRVSRGPAEALRGKMSGILDQHVRTTDSEGKVGFRFPEKDAVIHSYELSWLRNALVSFETVFHEEMRDAATYYVPRRGIFWTPGLVDTADEGFPKDLLGYVPDKARVEWRAAGRCLAFNLLSASGFHVARAVEGTLEAYYQRFCGQPGEALRSWHDYIEALSKVATSEADPRPAAKTISEIKQMKDDYRNPIMHPRVVLTEPDARMLFANGESLIIAMAQELSKAKSGVQSPLALMMKEAGETMS